MISDALADDAAGVQLQRHVRIQIFFAAQFWTFVVSVPKHARNGRSLHIHGLMRRRRTFMQTYARRGY